MSKQQVLDLINNQITSNGNGEITASVLRPILQSIVNQTNDLSGLLSELNTSDKTNIVNAINSILSVNIPAKTVLRNINITGVDFDKSEMEWVKDAINNTIASNGFFTANLGEQIVFTFDIVSNLLENEAEIQRKYYRLLTGNIFVNTVSEVELMPDGFSNLTLDFNSSLVINLGNIGTSEIEDAFNENANQPFTINGEKYIKAIQNSDAKLWKWIGGDGTFGNSSTLAETQWFVDLTTGAQPNVNENIPNLIKINQSYYLLSRTPTNSALKKGLGFGDVVSNGMLTDDILITRARWANTLGDNDITNFGTYANKYKDGNYTNVTFTKF